MRQKTFFAFVIAVSSVINLNAESIEMQSGRIKQFLGGPHSEAPEVDYDCELLVIKADTTYNSARIVVKNKFGQVLYDRFVDIKRQPQTIYMPDSDKRSIEIYCGKDVYWGVFEED